MRRKTLVHVPVNGDYQKQLDFEEEKRLKKLHTFHSNTIDLINTLRRNKIVYHTYRPTMFENGPEEPGDRIFDHVYIASDETGKYFFIAEPYIGGPAEPYEYDGVRYEYEEVVAAVAKWCRANDLNLEIRLNGPHCKDTPTTMFIISSK